MLGFLAGYKSYLYLILGIIVLAVIGYCHFLKKENTALLGQIATLELLAKEKTEALNVCSKNTDDLKNREKEISDNAKEAITQAKLESTIDYKSANDSLFRKPKVPVITQTNVAQYGGSNLDDKTKDYLAVQDSINEYIDSRQSGSGK